MNPFDKYDDYFNDGDDFLYVPLDYVFKCYIRDINLGNGTITIYGTDYRTGDYNRSEFYKLIGDIPDIYKILERY